MSSTAIRSTLALAIVAVAACGSNKSGTADNGKRPSQPSPDNRPAAGNPDGTCTPPADAAPEDVTHPDQVIGTGTPASCTGDAVVAAVAAGGVITFDCGPDPVTITLGQTAKVKNGKFSQPTQKVVIDGGNKVTLSGGGTVRILYQDTCDSAQGLTSPHCQDQETPQLTVQNLTFIDGNAKGQAVPDDPGHGGAGGAIFARGGRLKIVHSRFFNNICDDTGPDVGGGAVRALDQSQNLPVYIVDSTFGGQDDAGKDLGNSCSNGGALSSIDVSYTVLDSVMTGNKAIGMGANPAKAGTPGGGSGGAIYNDGNTYTLTICGSKITGNTANEGGGAIFFNSSDRSGSLIIQDSVLSGNPSAGFETQGYPGIFVLAKGTPLVTGSMLLP